MAATSTDKPDSMSQAARREADAYRHGEDRPLGGYLGLMGIYAAGTAAVGLAARVAGRRAPKTIKPWDFALLTMATHKLSRMIAKDPVASPIRAPFTRYEGQSGPGELAEGVRGHGIRHSIGELLTCPMCLAQWVATGFCVGFVVAPTTTRLAAATMSAVGGADFLQFAYTMLQQATEK
jgi:hypothetical protein